MLELNGSSAPRFITMPALERLLPSAVILA
jgi:hypothetical protein